jgi:sugar phosphate isomerase/epimerase
MPAKPRLSYQLYSSRKFPDLARQCAMLAKIGYRHAEPFGALFNEIDATERAFKDNGLSAPSAHVGLAMFREDLPGTLAKLKRLGVETAVVPAIPPTDRPKERAGWVALGHELSDLGKRLADGGLRLGWHNHSFEFETLPDGSKPLEAILGDDAKLLWEPDLAWIVRGNANPKEWLQRYRERIFAFHVKDIAPAGQCADEDGWADVGTGTIDFAGLLPAMRATPATIWVVEHDNPSDDARFARRSYDAVAKLAGAAS